MQRWILNLTGVALLATPLLLTLFGVDNVLRGAGGASPMIGMPAWLHLSVSAGTYLVRWSPAFIGALIILYANQRRR
jgi:hypothetical protein